MFVVNVRLCVSFLKVQTIFIFFVSLLSRKIAFNTRSESVFLRYSSIESASNTTLTWKTYYIGVLQGNPFTGNIYYKVYMEKMWEYFINVVQVNR